MFSEEYRRYYKAYKDFDIEEELTDPYGCFKEKCNGNIIGFLSECYEQGSKEFMKYISPDSNMLTLEIYDFADRFVENCKEDPELICMVLGSLTYNSETLEDYGCLAELIYEKAKELPETRKEVSQFEYIFEYEKDYDYY